MTRMLSILLFASLPLSACARDCAPQVKDGWVRLMPGNMPMQAGFGRIDNHCPMPATIVSASSPGKRYSSFPAAGDGGSPST